MNQELINVIKMGMIGELDSITLYQKAYDQSEGEVKAFFKDRIDEEKRHYNYLLQFYQELSKEQSISNLAKELEHDQVSSPMISSDFIKRIASDQILFSSISTAILLEKNAIDFYSKSADLITQPEIKSFYRVLVRWEKQHYDDLLEIQKEAELIFWDENRFQPF